LTSTKLHFARFEFKYLLNPQLRKELESELKYFLEFDPYVEKQPHHQYFVRSLYFDDPSYSAFYDKVDGIHTRSKFRVRTYTKELGDGTPQFLEIKGRYNNLVLKHRVQLESDGLASNVRADALSSQLLRLVPPSTVGQKFEYELFRKQLRPVALVDYLRRPYISRFDPEFRLTFDNDISTTMSRALFPSPRERVRQILPGYTIMEVKFRRTIPAWFHRLIQAYELRRVSISKICQAMEILELAHDPN
jgi:hypothetical protein